MKTTIAAAVILALVSATCAASTGKPAAQAPVPAAPTTAAAPAAAPAAATAPAQTPVSVSKMNTDTVKDLCATPDYQCIMEPVEVNLQGLDGKPFHLTLPAPLPIIQQGLITLYAGQAIDVEADVAADGALTGLKLVPTVTHPKKTLVMSLKQMKLKSGMSMIFKIKNPFDRALRYHASIQGLGGGDSIMTNTCPVPAKLQDSVSLPEPVFMISLAGLELLPAHSKEDHVCAY